MVKNDDLYLVTRESVEYMQELLLGKVIINDNDSPIKINENDIKRYNCQYRLISKEIHNIDIENSKSAILEMTFRINQDAGNLRILFVEPEISSFPSDYIEVKHQGIILKCTRGEIFGSDRYVLAFTCNCVFLN